MNKARAKVVKRQMAELGALVNSWDPIGVFDEDDEDGWPRDEYDCLVGPLLSRLTRGANAQEIREHLARELVDHFGLGPEMATSTEFPERVVRWYAQNWTTNEADR